MANIITDIQLSGITYQIQGDVTVDAALDSGSTNPVANSAITTAIDDKQDTLVSSQNIKTINNESILGSGNIDIQGGGGKAVSGGTNISITTGETADTINCTLPISVGTNTIEINKKNIKIGTNNTTSNYNRVQCAIGENNTASGIYSFAFGVYSQATNYSTVSMGYKTTANNQYQASFGRNPLSSVGSSTFGDSGNTLFVVGNATGNNNADAHNAFEIRQNGDIYLTLDGQDVKLQDHLGGGGSSYTAGDGIDITNDVISVTGKVDTSTYNTYTAATDTALSSKADTATTYTKTEVDTALASKQTTLTAGTNITIVDNVISATGGGGGGTVESAITSGSTNAVESKAIWSATTFNKGVLLTFNEHSESTNYPEGCTKLIVEVAEFGNMSDIDFFNDDQPLGIIHIDNTNWQGISVNVNFDGASYEISGTTVIITYPTVTSVTKIMVNGDTSYTYTAVVEGAWVNENTYMKSEVDAIANGLQNNINSKLDATAYTPTVVDSALNVASTNPVQNKVLYPELRIANGETETTLTFEDSESTNYPNGCTKLNVEVVGSGNFSSIDFLDDYKPLGNIRIDNWAGIIVNNAFEGASYEISGTTVIITYPTVTSVTKIRTSGIGNYVYKAITSLTTPLKDKVAANTTALGGLSLIKLTQAQYDALVTKDNSTLYVIVD